MSAKAGRSRLAVGSFVGSGSGSYEIVAKLGSGGWAEVYKARRPNGEEVALKTIRSDLAMDPAYRRRFRREQTRLEGLHHTNVCPVRDWAEDGDTLWLVMNLIDGETLADLVGREGPLAPARAADLIAQAAEGLHAVHTKRKLVHRDVRPKNLMVTDDDELSVIDFGIAKDYENSPQDTPLQLAREGAWAAPDFEVTPESDVYSLGLVLAYALTGAEPVQRRPAFPPNIAVDRRLRQVVRDATRTEQRDRPDAAEFAKLTRAAVAPRQRFWTRERPSTVTPPARHRSWALLAAVVVAGLAGAVVANPSDAPGPRVATAEAAPLQMPFAEPWERTRGSARVGPARLSTSASLDYRPVPGTTLTFGRLSATVPVRRLVKGARPARATIGPYVGLRYAKLPAAGGDGMSVFLIPTTTGYATFACRAPAAGYAGAQRRCNGLIAQARVLGARSGVPSPSPAFARQLEAAFTRLGAVQRAWTGRLRSGSIRRRAAAADRLASAYGALSGRLRRADEAVEDRADVRRATLASAAVEDSYGRLAKALRTKDHAAYGRAAAAIRREYDEITRALEGLSALGYDVRFT